MTNYVFVEDDIYLGVKALLIGKIAEAGPNGLKKGDEITQDLS